jgi:predicted enzyme related to lactoylglutathione lyase
VQEASIGLVLDCADPETLGRDVDGEVARLETIGARRLEAEARAEHGSRWVIMADPEGNEFCVCNAGQGAG